MKKLAMFFLLALLMFTMLFQTGCSSDSTTDDVDPIVIDIEVTNLGQEAVIDTFDTDIATSFIVEVQLSGLTKNYSQIDFYFGDDTTPLDISWDNATLRLLEDNQNIDAVKSQTISTLGMAVGDYDLKVVAVGTNFATDEVIVPIYLEEPNEESEWINFAILAPDTTEYAIGDIIEFEIGLLGNQSMLSSFDAYIPKVSTEPFFTVSTPSEILKFSYDTQDLVVGNYEVKFQITDKHDEIKEKVYNFTLIEFIPTFDITDTGGAGYELKSIVQTADGGYITVASDSSVTGLGTRVVKYKYNKETEQVDVLWTSDDINPIPANVGIAESACEDREYDGGIVIAGWRYNGTDKDTWVRKISSEDGSLIWNKHFGYPGIDDGATVIRKSIDDGFIIGGYTYNYYRAFDGLFTEFIIGGDNEVDVDSVTYNWDTGYDVRLLKVYSNGNENWGYNTIYSSHRAWHDITGHVRWWQSSITAWWVRKMGDQYITDLVATADGNFLVTGWNNSRLYDGNSDGNPDFGSNDKDMFFAEFSNLGSIITTMTWNRMSKYDAEHINSDNGDDFWVWDDVPNLAARLGSFVFGANQLGTITDDSEDTDEIGYGLTESHGGYGGQVVMVGRTYEKDDTPVKSKFDDGWVVEFLINGDDDGAMWEYSFGAAELEDKAFGIDQTKDDGYIITGYTTGSDKQTWTYKLNKDLLVVWSKKYDAAGDDWGVKALQCRDGGYITGGNVGTGTDVRARLIKRNKLGEENLK